MELAFMPKPMRYLKPVLWDRQTKEETAQTIVPDSCPDVGRIVACHAVAVMRTKELRQGSAAVSGGIRAGVTYVAEGENAPRTLEVYLPFSVQTDCPQLTENGLLQCCCRVRSADARMVNSRKIMVRVNLLCEMTGYEEQEETFFDLQNPPECLQTHKTEYTMLLPAEGTERSFQMTEELHLPANRPLQGDIYRFTPQVEVLEQRLAGNKAVFKGMVRVKLLYATQDGALNQWETELPFSQFCELKDVYDEEEISIKMQLTGCELERTLTQEGEGLLLSLHLLAQCTVLCHKKVELTDDAYTLQGELLPQWQEYTISNRLDKQMLSRSLRESKDCEISDVADVQLSLDYPQKKRVQEGVEISVPATAHILYYDKDGQLQGMTLRTELTERVSMADNADCRVWARCAGDAVAIPAGTTVELRCPVNLEVECIAEQAYRSLCGGEIRDTEKKNAPRPAVIVRRSRMGESLWDIAKENGTTVEKIRSANRLDAAQTEAGILLIPT